MKIKVFPESEDPEVRRFDRMVEVLTLLLFVTTTLLVCCSCSSTKVFSLSSGYSCGHPSGSMQ